MSAFQILYVDDDSDSCEMISLLLCHAGEEYSVTTVTTAEEALIFMESRTFDLYILDLWLPKMNGVELCRRIRKRDPNTPVLFFSALARPADRIQAEAAGANDYLIKPNDLDKFENTVKRLLKENKP